MQEEITTELIEWKTTTYSCDVDGCDFTTENKTESDKHYGDKHAVKVSDFIGNEFLLRFDSEEDFNAYCKAHGIRDRFANWHDPGWYRSYSTDEPCGRGCCSDYCGHLDPASWIGIDWQKKIKKYQDRLTELAQFLGEDGEFLLEDD